MTGLHQRPAWYPQEDSNLQPSGSQPDALSFELRGYVRPFSCQRAARMLVPGGRVELPRVLPHQPLRLARLPIPPSRRMLMVGAGGLEPPQSEDVASTARWNCRYPMPPLVLSGARERSRTSTGLLPHGSEPCASTCSATRAYGAGDRSRTCTPARAHALKACASTIPPPRHWHPREDSNPELLIRSQA